MTAAAMAASLVRRDDLVRDQLAHLPYGSRPLASPPVRVGATGTDDDLLVLAWTAEDLTRERACGAAMLGALGVRPGMRVANALPGALATPGSLLVGDVIEELGGLDVPLGEPVGEAAARAAWELFDRVACDVLVVEPATAPVLFAAAPSASRPWWRGIIWLGAGATPAPPAGFAGWQRAWLAVPEASSFVAGSCAAGLFHVAPHVGAEVVDGTLVVTVAGRVARYASGVGARAAASCPCGAGGTVVEVS
jgi:hypothetical protein